MASIEDTTKSIEKLTSVIENVTAGFSSFLNTITLTYKTFEAFIGPVQQFDTVMYNLARNTGMTYRETLQLNTAIEKITKSTVFAQNELLTFFSEVQKERWNHYRLI